MVARLLALVFLAGCAGQSRGLEVINARAPAPPDTSVAAAYFTVVNHGPADTLVGVTIEGARAAAIHERRAGPDGSPMRPVPVLVLPANATVRLAPGGLHVMIEGLARRPSPGDTLGLTLTFRRHPAMTVALPVVRYEDLTG